MTGQGKNEPVTSPSLLQAAVDELYSEPLAEFTARRKTLAAAAKKAGDRVAAMAIGALRKPTLSADTVNRLVRHAPREVDELLQLGTELRTAEKALDAAELRRLGDRRRRLVGDLTQLAFDITEQSSPSGAVRDEVTATLNAALADEEVAQRLVSGALVTQARWDGFGSTQLPELAASIPLAPPRRPAPQASEAKSAGDAHQAAAPARSNLEPPMARSAQGKSRTSRPVIKAADGAPGVVAEQSVNDAAGHRATEAVDRAARSTAERAGQAEARRKLKVQEKERRLSEAAASAAADAAAAAVKAAAHAQELVATIDRRISELNLQLAHQRQLLADAQRALRAAENQRRAAQLAATKAGAPAR